MAGYVKGKDMKIFITSLCELTKRIIPIGYEGENLYTRVQVDCSEVFSAYPSATVSLAIKGPTGDIYPAIVTREADSIVWNVTSSILSEDGAGSGQLTFTDDNTVVKSAIFNFMIYDSLIVDGETPDPVEDWIAEANNKLGEIEAAVEQIPQTIDTALAEAKASGEFDGEDGFSPVVSVTEITDGHRVSITDAEGTESFDVMNGDPGQPGQPGAPGQPGQDGVSPTVSVTPITDGHEVTITDATGAHSFDVMNGAKGDPGDPGTPGDPTTLIDDSTTTATNKVWSAKKSADECSDLKSAIDEKQDAPETAGTAGQVLGLDSNLDPVWTTPQSGGVSDVQVNGTSVVNQGVANVPLANTNNPGVVKVSSTYGTMMYGSNSNVIGIIMASDNDIKSGGASYKAINPGKGGNFSFYGLAKAAGDATQSASSNAVGVYTESAKSAISQMLDAPETVSGTTPSITAKPGVRYVCGECATLTITAPASGIIDVTFESGSTPTVLTVTPPTGMTMKWIGDDPTALEANKTYEINIKDGCLGMVVSWT